MLKRYLDPVRADCPVQIILAVFEIGEEGDSNGDREG